MPRADTDKAEIFDNRTWKQHQRLRNKLGHSPHKPCPCQTDGCTDILLECWGHDRPPYFRKLTSSRTKVIGDGSCGMTVIHATAQAMIAAELNGRKKVNIKIKCKDCGCPSVQELRLDESEECRTEAYYRQYNEFYLKDRRNFADLGVVKKGSRKGTQPRLVIEVYQTCRTAEQNREGVQWFEVSAKQVYAQTDAVHGGAVLTLDCVKTLTESCDECKFEQRLTLFRAYLCKLDDAFPVHLRKFIELSQGKGHGSPVRCVLCDKYSSITWQHMGEFNANANEYERFRLCDQHIEALYRITGDGTSTPEVFFSEAHVIQATRIKQAEVEFEKERAKQEARRIRAEETQLKKQRLKALNRLDSQAAGERRSKKLKKTEREEVSMQEIERHVRKHWSEYRACFVTSHEAKLDRVILKLQMEERRCGEVAAN